MTRCMSILPAWDGEGRPSSISFPTPGLSASANGYIDRRFSMNVASIVRIAASIAWLAFFGVIVIAVVRASRGRPVRALTTVIVVLGIGALLFSVASAGLVFVQPEDRGVVISAVAPGGYRQQALEPGLHWIIPFFENVINYPIKKQTYTMSVMPTEGQIVGDDSISARTADGQEIFVDASVIFSLDPQKVVGEIGRASCRERV